MKVEKLKENMVLEVPCNSEVKVLAFKPDPHDDTLTAKELGTVLCSRNDYYTKFVVWRYRIDPDNILNLYSGEYFKTLAKAKEYFS